MFAYCGNNPVNCADPSGAAPDEFGEKFEQVCVYDGAGAGAGMDILSAAVLGVAVGVSVGVTNLFLWAAKSVGEALQAITTGICELGELIAFSYNDYLAKQIRVGKCLDVAQEMKRKNDDKGDIIHLFFPYAFHGYVVSERYPFAISSNGNHYGYLLNGIVYCNVYPEGVPMAEWIRRFADASGKPPIVRIY